ncbi:hypothetical protein WIE37_24080 [Escherichia coli]|uniref:hypothetical protein n=1 Tax=Escherichia coli TaxID=562 RepID=UPI00339BDA95
MKAENARQVQGLIELEKFNPETLCSGESWMAPSASDVTNGAIVIHTQRLKSDPGGNLLS